MVHLKIIPALLSAIFSLSSISGVYGNDNAKVGQINSVDTIFVGSPALRTELITPYSSRYTLLVHVNNTYKSIKFLERNVTIDGERLTVVQKLYNGIYTNTDNVIVNRKTLMPIESHSDINTSLDSFVYHKNRVTGTLLNKEANKKGALTKIDTVFSKPLFNGLIYAETFQATSYEKSHPFYIAEYVPGHGTKFTRVEYLRDVEIIISGSKIAAKLLQTNIGKSTIYYWLNANNQEILKIEAKFPAFDYL